MNEYDRELLNEFVTESTELLEQVEETLLGLDESASLDPEAINEIFRAVHSVKGTSGFFGLDVIGSLSHIMENVLGEMREGRLSPEPRLIDLLLSSNDRLRALVLDTDSSQSADVSEAVASLQAWLHGAPPQETDEKSAAAPEPAPEAASPAADEAEEGFEITEELQEDLRRHGLLLYRLNLSTRTDITARKRSLDAFVKHISSVGTILKITPSVEALKATPETEDHPFTVWMSSVLDPVLAPMGLAIDAARIEVLGADGKAAKATPPAPPAADTQPPVKLAVAEAAPEPAPEPAPAQSEPSPEPADAAAAPEVKRPQPHNSNETLRVKTSLLDRLMQMAGELVLARNRLLRRLDGQQDKIEGIGAILGELNGITSEMQEQIMQTRLQPIGTVYGRFSRVVRDMSKKLGKSVRLDTIGGDVELDKALLEGLADPLTHMLRNSIDHGVEDPDGREAAGKPRQGTVRIRAYHEGGMVNLDIEDDGRGIDVEKVRLAAIRKGLLSSEQAAKTTDTDILNLIFRPGFSTAAKVTDVSGRGVGMDVVRTNIEKLGGVVEARTHLGEGTTVSIKLPLTLAIVTSLIVDVEGQRFALPQVGLESVVRLRPSDVAKRIERIRDMDVLRYRERLLPIVRLTDVLGMERTYVDRETGERMVDRRGRLSDRRAALAKIEEDAVDKREDDNDRRNALSNVLRILVLRIGRNSFGLVVDAIVENEEIVVKPLSRFLRDCQCFSGATILGDGTIAMILDPVNIAQAAKLTFSDLSRDAAEESHLERVRALRERVPLIHFSNGGPETFALPLAQVARVENIPKGEVQRVGHKEYITYRGQALPLVRLHEHLDVAMTMEEPDEMKVIIPNLGACPAGIVAHEVLDAREVELEVDEATIRGQGLIGSAILGDDIVLLVDTYGLMSSAGVAVACPGEQVLQGRRALVVDDTPFMRRVTHGYLADAGMQVESVSDGVEAWDAIKSGDFDVVVTDMRMPNLDGAGLLARLRGSEELAQLPVVALASEAPKDCQFNGHAQKLDRPELIETLTEVFGQVREEAV